MKFTLRPTKALEGSLTALEKRGAGGAFTPVNQVLDRVQSSNGKLLRRGNFNLVVEIEPAFLEDVMPRLQGWVAQPVQTTSTVSAFDGMLRHVFGTKPSGE